MLTRSSQLVCVAQILTACINKSHKSNTLCIIWGLYYENCPFAASHPQFAKPLTTAKETLLNLLSTAEKSAVAPTNCTKVTEKFLIIS